jgi:hypothetical protein
MTQGTSRGFDPRCQRNSIARATRLERPRQLGECGASVTPAAEAAGFRSDPKLRRARSSQCGSVPDDAVRETSIQDQPNGWQHSHAQEVATGLLRD